MPFRANLEGSTDSEKQRVVDCVRIVSNFPKPGLEFKDMSILSGQPADPVPICAAVAGIESRGFIFLAPVALGLRVPFVPFRKPGKLPCEAESKHSPTAFLGSPDINSL